MSDIKEKQVANYLLKHKDFFEKNTDVLAKLSIPHPRGAGTLSLLERQITLLREQLKLAENNFKEFIEINNFNYKEQLKVQKFVIKLISINTEELVIKLLEQDSKKLFNLKESNVFMWKNHKKNPIMDNIIRHVNNKNVFCGKLPINENKAIFKYTNKSIALLPIGRNASIGLYAISSRNDKFLDSNISTDLLSYIAQLITIKIKETMIK